MSNTEAEIVIIHKKTTSCKGKEAPYDHPLIYLEISNKNNKAICPYCSKEFLYQAK